MLRMKIEAILIPSGRSKMFVMLVYTKTTVIDMNSTHRRDWRQATIATANAAELMSTMPMVPASTAPSRTPSGVSSKMIVPARMSHATAGG